MHGDLGDSGKVERYGEYAILLLGLTVGLFCFFFYYWQGLTVSHYDAKAHLMVARRVFDSTAPGYAQLGAHWLPLTHLLYLPLVFFESQYRSGFLPALLSVAAFVLSGWLTYRIALRATESRISAFLSGAILVASANLQYLQSCPLTEPLYIVFLLLAVDGIYEWRASGFVALPWLPAVWASLGSLCRYEGWYVLGGAIALILWDWKKRRLAGKKATRALALFLSLFMLPLAIHFGYMYAQVHDSFLLRVAQGNPTPFETYKRPFLSLVYHAGELIQAGSFLVFVGGMAGLLFCFLDKDKLEARLPLLLLWLPSLINISALYWGMVYRVRYSCILIPALAVFSGVAASKTCSARRLLRFLTVCALMLPWLPWIFPHEWKFHFLYPGPGLMLLPVAASLVYLISEASERYGYGIIALLVLGMQVPVLLGESRPVLVEALEHQYLEGEREQLLTYLRLNYDGSKILVDSLKQAPLVYDSKIALRHFIWNEGDKTQWKRAVEFPAAEAGWLCAIKGDEIWNRLNVDPHWAYEYALVSHSENFVLYRLRKRGR